MPVANGTGPSPSVGPSSSPSAPLTPNGPDIVNCTLQAHNDGEQSTIFEAEATARSVGQESFREKAIAASLLRFKVTPKEEELQVA
ncbi:hypothetical protein BGZ94_006143, partial [Podila epigama]